MNNQFFVFSNGKSARFAAKRDAHLSWKGMWRLVDEEDIDNIDDYLYGFTWAPYYNDMLKNHKLCVDALDMQPESEHFHTYILSTAGRKKFFGEVFDGENHVPVEERFSVEALPVPNRKVLVDDLKDCARAALGWMVYEFHGFEFPNPTKVARILFAIGVPKHETNAMINAIADAVINEDYTRKDIMHDPLICKKENQWRNKALVAAHQLVRTHSVRC